MVQMMRSCFSPTETLPREKRRSAEVHGALSLLSSSRSRIQLVDAHCRTTRSKSRKREFAVNRMGKDRESKMNAGRISPHENDVLMGRGGLNNQWSGNEKLREVARQRCGEYRDSTKKGKSQLSMDIVYHMRSLDPPARFLRKNAATQEWEDIPDNQAREKVSQVLRDAVGAVFAKDGGGDEETAAATRGAGGDDIFPMISTDGSEETSRSHSAPLLQTASSESSFQPIHPEAATSSVSLPGGSTTQPTVSVATAVSKRSVRPGSRAKRAKRGHQKNYREEADDGEEFDPANLNEYNATSSHAPSPLRRHSATAAFSEPVERAMPRRAHSSVLTYTPIERLPPAVYESQTIGGAEFDLFGGELLAQDNETEDGDPPSPPTSLYRR